MFVMNHENGGFDCPGCAWPDDPERPAPRHLRERHQARHLGDDPQTVDRDFFAAHTVTELSGWTDFAPGGPGPAHRADELRRREPTATCRSPGRTPSTLVGATLRGLDEPEPGGLLHLGPAGNEATFLYQLWAREFGTNNLPDCSNMCHEATGRALQAALGTGKGTCDLDDWETRRMRCS